MISIDEAFVDAAAPNAEAIKNGRALAAKGQLSALRRSSDGSLLFGNCAGSGKLPYQCSADFANPQKPVFRCSCPSRQFPCKHCLGLMYAFAAGKPFAEDEVPAELAAKREKALVQAEKRSEKASEAPKPKKINKSALKKKIHAQLEGLGILESLISDIVRRGLGSLDAKAALEIDRQAKQLGDAFLPGAQGVLNEFTALFRAADGRFRPDDSAGGRETVYREGLERLTRAHAMAKRGREYLEARAADEDLKPDTSTSIAAWLGHAWQLAELEEQGCAETDAELVQLSFEIETNHARQQDMDVGVWFHRGSGKLYRTLNIRPWKASAYIRQDDTQFQCVQTPKLFRYPGEGAPRVRWDAATFRPVTPDDLAQIRNAASPAIADVVKIAREQLKSPLGERSAWALIQFARLGKVGDAFVLQDCSGARIELVNPSVSQRPPALPLFASLPAAAFENQTLLGCLRQDWERDRLVMEPVSLVSPQGITRLGY